MWSHFDQPPAATAEAGRACCLRRLAAGKVARRITVRRIVEGSSAHRFIPMSRFTIVPKRRRGTVSSPQQQEEPSLRLENIPSPAWPLQPGKSQAIKLTAPIALADAEGDPGDGLFGLTLSAGEQRRLDRNQSSSLVGICSLQESEEVQASKRSAPSSIHARASGTIRCLRHDDPSVGRNRQELSEPRRLNQLSHQGCCL